MEKSFAPIIDGNMDGPDSAFQLIYDYLQAIGIKKADKVLFVADGAHWIWNRVSLLIEDLGLLTSQVHELIDFYHAVEHRRQGSFFALQHGLLAQRKAWVKKYRKLLLKGQTKQVVASVQVVCRGRNGKAIITERLYFIRNARTNN